MRRHLKRSRGVTHVKLWERIFQAEEMESQKLIKKETSWHATVE